MTTLSYTQELFLCALNDKGNFSSLSEAPLCLIVGSILELLDSDYLARDEKGKLIPGRAGDNAPLYLKPAYDASLSYKKPQSISSVAMNFSSKMYRELFSAIGDSLVQSGNAELLTESGLFRDRTRYVSTEAAVKKVVEKLRAELLEDGMVTDETLYLAALLDVSGLINNYFSKYESKAVKKRLEELRATEAYAVANDVIEEITALIVVIIASTAV